MARIVRKRLSGEPQPTRQRNSWGFRPGRNSSRSRLSIRMLHKTPVEDAVMAGINTTSVNAAGTQRVTAGTVIPGTQARGGFVRKVVNMTTKLPKGTKRVSTPSPTNRGGAKSPYGRRRT